MLKIVTSREYTVHSLLENVPVRIELKIIFKVIIVPSGILYQYCIYVFGISYLI